MERPSWLWRRKSSGRSPGETESSGSLSSYSERCSDDQEALKASPNHVKSPEVSSNLADCEVHETVKSLNEKLSDALLDIKAKEDLVKQHAKVAEEAVSGWETAETEVAVLKQQLEAAAEKNSALEDRISHLDGALKECVRQLRQSREEQEQKVHEALIKKTHEWESDKSELERRLIELHAQLEAKKSVAATTIDHDLRLMLEALEKENFALKVELLAQSEDLQKQMLERELSTHAAETACKQHLESKKKMAKLEAECRRLRAAARKMSAVNDRKVLANSVCVESLTDSQSDSGERLFNMDNEPSWSDSWASALVPELDQFKNEKVLTRNLTASSIEIDLMDDFLEMERLAGLPEADGGSADSEFQADSNHAVALDGHSKAELEAVHRQMAELEEKVEKMTTEKVEMEMALAETRNQLKISCGQLIVAEDKLVELQRHLNSTNASKHIFEVEVEAMEIKRKELEHQVESANFEVGKLRVKASLLEGKVEEEKALHAEFAAKCQTLESVEAKRKELESLLELANLKVEKLHDKVCLLERQVEEERTLSAEFAAKCRNMKPSETNTKELEYKLMSAYLQIEELHVKVSLLEGKVEEEKAFSADFASKVEIEEAEKRELKSQLELAHSEARKLCERIGLLEREAEDARALSAEFAAKCQNLEGAEAMRKEMESQLNLAQLEVGELHEKVSLLEVKVDEVRALSEELAANVEAVEAKKKALESQLESAQLEVERLSEYASRSQNLEDELSRRKREAELRCPTSTNGDPKIRQEKELAVAAGKLAECQKTIVSLGTQLKSLAAFEDFMLEDEKPELTEASLDLTR